MSQKKEIETTAEATEVNQNEERAVMDVDYYTKSQTNNLLGLKTNRTSADLEVVEYLPDPSHSNWKITFHRLSAGIVTATLHLVSYPATHSGGFEDLLTNVPSRFRPNANVYYMTADFQNKERCVGILTNGTVRVYDSVNSGCYGSVTYMNGDETTGL